MSDPFKEIAKQHNIHTLRIPTPFAIGRVNLYLIEDEPLTLVDTGPNSGKSLDELEHQLSDLGHSIEEIELLILTHQHIDHTGLAEIIAKRSGAIVAGTALMAGMLRNYGDSCEAEDLYAVGLMKRYGIPEDMVQALASVSRSFRGWGADVEITRPLGKDEVVELSSRSFITMPRPGHSPSDTIFWDESGGVLIAADHLIKHISSNPLIHRPLDTKPGDEGPRPQALVTYLDSLARTSELPAKVVLSGHGEPIYDHKALIEERVEFHRKRAERICGLIKERPSTGYELAQSLWGNVAVTQAFLTLSEVVGHADILLNEGRIVEREEGGVVLFEEAR